MEGREVVDDGIFILNYWIFFSVVINYFCIYWLVGRFLLFYRFRFINLGLGRIKFIGGRGYFEWGLFYSVCNWGLFV